MKFVALNLDTARIILMTDASFANVSAMKSQIGYLLLMADAEGRWIEIHYGTNKCKRIARSVMAAEVQILMHVFVHAYFVRDLLEELIGLPLALEAKLDSKKVFNVVPKDGQQRKAHADSCLSSHAKLRQRRIDANFLDPLGAKSSGLFAQTNPVNSSVIVQDHGVQYIRPVPERLGVIALN